MNTNQMKNTKQVQFSLALMLIAVGSYGGDLSFSDPARVRPMPAWAVGQSSRAPDLDAFQFCAAGAVGLGQ